MTNFQDISEAIPAKHVLFVMDSCYSGLALTRGGVELPSQNYLNEISRREARQMFTAGGADQQVADNGPNGHSVFTWTLLQGLDGRADLNGDGVITATELAAYVAPAVSALSHQTPAFGNLPGTEGGDFIFNLKHETEFLNGDSAQLDDQAIKVNTELEKLRSQMRAEELKNEELRKQLATAQAQLKQGIQPSAAARITWFRNWPVPTPLLRLRPNYPPTLPPQPTTRACAFTRKSATADAAAKFTEASNLQPASALFANNAGFAYYRMEQYDEAAKWFLQTDRSRSQTRGRLSESRRCLPQFTEESRSQGCLWEVPCIGAEFQERSGCLGEDEIPSLMCDEVRKLPVAQERMRTKSESTLGEELYSRGIDR